MEYRQHTISTTNLGLLSFQVKFRSGSGSRTQYLRGYEPRMVYPFHSPASNSLYSLTSYQLLYYAISFSCLGRHRTYKPKCCINSAVRLPIPPQDNIEIHFCSNHKNVFKLLYESLSGQEGIRTLVNSLQSYHVASYITSP